MTRPYTGGDNVTKAEFKGLSDDELDKQIQEIQELRSKRP